MAAKMGINFRLIKGSGRVIAQNNGIVEKNPLVMC